MDGTEKASGLQQLKYFPKGRELRKLVLVGSGNNCRLTPKRVARLAAGTTKKFYDRQKKVAIIGTAIVTVLVTALMTVLAFLCSNATMKSYADRSALYVLVMKIGFFTSAAITIPIAGCFLPSRLDYGQNAIDEVRQHRVKRIRAWLNLPFFGALIGTIVCGFVAAGIETFTLASAAGVFWLIFYGTMAGSASLFFLLKNMEGCVCPSCKMVNTVFVDYHTSYGREERRLVSTGSHSATIGNVYDGSGKQVGTVTGQVRDYGYEVGRSYTSTETRTCAYCKNISSSTSEGYEKIRMEKE